MKKRSLLSKAVSIMLLFGLVLSSLALSTNFSTSTQALTNDSWDQDIDIDWYDKSLTKFEIYTEQQLAGLAKLVNDRTDTFENKQIYLKSEMNLEDHYWVPIGLGDIHDEKGKEINVFKGYFNGGDHEISSMRIGEGRKNLKDIENGGLFGCVYDGTLEHVKVGSGSHVYITGNNAGGICSSLYYSKIISCSNSATVYTSGYQAGGIAGMVSNCGLKIVSCSNNGTVVSRHHSGGIVGLIRNPNVHVSLKLSDCINSGRINSIYNGNDSQAGGICAKSDGRADFMNCKNTGKISAVQSSGICSFGTGSIKIEDCKNYGMIVARPCLGSDFSVAGGIAGCFFCDTLEINNCENNNSVSVQYSVKKTMSGGICGTAFSREAKVTNCINNNVVSADAECTPSVGGVIGYVLYPRNLTLSDATYMSGNVFVNGNAINKGIGNLSRYDTTVAI